jgi:hypothetical protein
MTEGWRILYNEIHNLDVLFTEYSLDDQMKDMRCVGHVA